MDELGFPASSNSCPSPPASFSTAGYHHQHHHHHHQEHGGFLAGEDVLEGWLGADDWLDVDEPPNPTNGGVALTWAGEGSLSRSPVPVPGNNFHHLPDSVEPAAPPSQRRRGRRPASGGGPALCHVEAERQRRDKLNRRFCELRAAVPTVSRMDKASVLADATTYIGQLRRRVDQLEADAAAALVVSNSNSNSNTNLGGEIKQLEVQMVGAETAMLRLTTATAAARHAPARLMVALRSLDLTVQNACVCLVGDVTVQDAVVEVPDAAAALRDARALRAALLHRLQQRTG